jgi:hypothetical protein
MYNLLSYRYGKSIRLVLETNGNNFLCRRAYACKQHL